MLVLKIIGVLLVGLAFLYCVMQFNNHCNNKFGYVFFNKTALIIVTIAVIFFMIGSSWYSSALKDDGDTLNGIVLMIISALICVAVFIFNIKKSNLLYGFFGSAVQITVFSVIASLGIIILIIYAAAVICFGMITSIDDRNVTRN